MIKLTFTGDIMSSMLQNEACITSNGDFDYSKLFANIDLSDTNYLCGNLETPVAGKALGYTYTPTQFNTPNTFLAALKKAGFHFFSTANNHVMDRGEEGMYRTLKVLDEYGFDHTGSYKSIEDSNSIFVKTIKGVRIAFLSFTYGTNANDNHNILQTGHEYFIDLLRSQSETPIPPQGNRFSHAKLLLAFKHKGIYYLGKLKKLVSPPKASEYFCGTILDCVTAQSINDSKNTPYIDRFISKIRQAKELADITVLCLHIGGQYNNELGEYTKYIYSLLANENIDVIIGNHPHCVLGSDWDGNKLITYSLGNFTFTPRNGWYNFDVFADYNILLNVEIDDSVKKISRCTYSVLKVIRGDDDISRTYYLYDLIQSEQNKEERRQLEFDNQKVIERFTGKHISTIQKEYIL